MRTPIAKSSVCTARVQDKRIVSWLRLALAVSLLSAGACRAGSGSASSDAQPSMVQPSSKQLVLVPAKRLGAIEIGMSRSEVAALQLGPSSLLPRTTVDGTTEKVGFYTVNFDAQSVVRAVSVQTDELEPGIELAIGTTSRIFESKPTLSGIAALLPNCTEFSNRGARGVRCAEDSVWATVGGKNPDTRVTLSVRRPDAWRSGADAGGTRSEP